MKRIFNALFVGALLAATMAFGPPALASPEMGNDLIAAYNQSTDAAPFDTTKADFATHVSATAASTDARRSPAGGEPLTYTSNNDTAFQAQTRADATGVVGPGWRSPSL